MSVRCSVLTKPALLVRDAEAPCPGKVANSAKNTDATHAPTPLRRVRDGSPTRADGITSIGRAGCSGDLLPPSPPAEKATTSEDQAGQSSAGDGVGNGSGRSIDRNIINEPL